MFAEKSLLMGDEVADLLLEYTRLLAESARRYRHRPGDQPRRKHQDAAFLLNAATVMMAESTNSTMEAPANDEAVRYMQDRIDRLLHPPTAQPEEALPDPDYDLLRPGDRQPTDRSSGDRGRAQRE